MDIETVNWILIFITFALLAFAFYYVSKDDRKRKSSK